MSSRKHGRRGSDDEHHRKKKSKSDTSHKSTSLPGSIDLITRDDYFEKATEFRLWLKEERGKYFDDLDSDDTRHYFKKFVKAWNRYELPDKFYKGLSSAQLSSSDTTRYKWGFAAKLDHHELDTTRDFVDSMTNKGKIGASSSSTSNSGGAGHRRQVGPAMPSRGYDQAAREEEEEAARANRKAEARRARHRREDLLDEVAPKETGREAQLLKRREKTAYHKRERSPDVELSEADLMGTDDFKARLAAEKRAEERRQRRREEVQQQRFGPIQEKLAERKAKEDATIAMFRKMAEERKQRGGF